jgi:hypothetical protein
MVQHIVGKLVGDDAPDEARILDVEEPPGDGEVASARRPGVQVRNVDPANLDLGLVADDAPAERAECVDGVGMRRRGPGGGTGGDR